MKDHLAGRVVAVEQVESWKPPGGAEDQDTTTLRDPRLLHGAPSAAMKIADIGFDRAFAGDGEAPRGHHVIEQRGTRLVRTGSSRIPPGPCMRYNTLQVIRSSCPAGVIEAQQFGADRVTRVLRVCRQVTGRAEAALEQVLKPTPSSSGVHSAAAAALPSWRRMRRRPQIVDGAVDTDGAPVVGRGVGAAPQAVSTFTSAMTRMRQDRDMGSPLRLRMIVSTTHGRERTPRRCVDEQRLTTFH